MGCSEEGHFCCLIYRDRAFLKSVFNKRLPTNGPELKYEASQSGGAQVAVWIANSGAWYRQEAGGRREGCAVTPPGV